MSERYHLSKQPDLIAPCMQDDAFVPEEVTQAVDAMYERAEADPSVLDSLERLADLSEEKVRGTQAL